MNITKAAPYYDNLVIGKQLQVTVASSGHALVEGFIGNVKFISQTVTATTIFGAYLNNVNFKVSNLTGLVDVVELQVLTTYNPAAIAETGGTMSGVTVNNCPMGQTTPAAVRTSNLSAPNTDSSGTAGNATNSSPKGRAAFAAAGTSVVITSTLVTASSTVLVSLGGTDTTLTSLRVTAAAGSFTVTGNAAATAITPFDFFVIN